MEREEKLEARSRGIMLEMLGMARLGANHVQLFSNIVFQNLELDLTICTVCY